MFLSFEVPLCSEVIQVMVPCEVTLHLKRWLSFGEVGDASLFYRNNNQVSSWGQTIFLGVQAPLPLHALSVIPEKQNILGMYAASEIVKSFCVAQWNNSKPIKQKSVMFPVL